MAADRGWLARDARSEAISHLDKFVALPDGSIEIVRDMAGSHDDFLRLLPAATEGRRYTVDGTSARIAIDASRYVTIMLREESVRRIGPTMALALTPVHYGFHGMTQDEIDSFLLRFDRYYQRGGG